MQYIKWTFWILFWTLLLSFLHYTLPRWDTVRIVNTYEKRIDFGENKMFWSTADAGNDVSISNRDVSFIQAIRPNGRPMVYRNEDTGWTWPPYFKFNTANLQATATNLISTAETPRWVAIKRYGWRNQFISIYPNAVGVKEVDGPDSFVIPWTSLIILSVIGVLFWAINRRWRRFMENRVDPMLDDIEETMLETHSGIQGWFDSWFGPKQRRKK